MRIRVATKAIPKVGLKPDEVKTLDDVAAGVKMPWVELDGHRFTDLMSASFEMGYGALETSVTFKFIGPVEIVYVQPDGEGDWREIGSVATGAWNIPEMDCDTIIDVVEEIDPQTVEFSKEHAKFFRNAAGDMTDGGWRGPEPS